ncbi:MAG: ABC transporter permease [Kangiellaceae bacterium]|nr:ABC transporter permease [Kangiellaceae bacterium]
MFEIKPILSALLRHKSSTLLIILQIAITFAVVVNGTSIIKQRMDLMSRDTGLVNDKLITLNINSFGKNSDQESNIRADLELLRSLPGVVDAAPMNQIPLSGSGDSSGVAVSQEAHDNQEVTGAGMYRGDSHMLNTLGVKLVAGRLFSEDEVTYTSERPDVKALIITQSLADNLFPNGDALGKLLYFGGGIQVPIVGIVEHMSGSWVSWSSFDNNVLMPMVQLQNFRRYLIRAEDKQAANHLLGEVEKLLIERNRERVVTGVRSMDELIERAYSDDSAMMTILWIVVILLVLITALGIVGIVSFNVNQRIKQIGTRRALGATKADILRYFVTENLLITSLGLFVGIMMTVGFNVFLADQFEMPEFNWALIPIGTLIMFVIGIVSVWLPAQRASKVSPAIATQSI